MSALTPPSHRNTWFYAIALLVSLFFANPAHGQDAHGQNAHGQDNAALASHDADTHTGGADNGPEPLAGDEAAGDEHDREAAESNDHASDQQNDAEGGPDLNNNDSDSASP